MVMAKGYKDNKLLKMITILVVSVICIGLFVAIFFSKGDDRIANIVIFMVFFLALIVFVTITMFQKLKKDDVVIYKEENNALIINCYRKCFNINLSDIEEIKYRNKGLASLGQVFFVTEYSYGRLIFKLKNNKKITTPIVDEVKQSYENILNLID